MEEGGVTHTALSCLQAGLVLVTLLQHRFIAVDPCPQHVCSVLEPLLQLGGQNPVVFGLDDTLVLTVHLRYLSNCLSAGSFLTALVISAMSVSITESPQEVPLLQEGLGQACGPSLAVLFGSSPLS